ncbi:hypothetical protein DVH05_010086 [Phytophthora capsici]|nr:hypothetical protein DVH05_010086 [Phytophthora capsici]
MQGVNQRIFYGSKWVSKGLASKFLMRFQNLFRAAENYIQDEWENYEQSPTKKDVRCGNFKMIVSMTVADMQNILKSDRP